MNDDAKKALDNAKKELKKKKSKLSVPTDFLENAKSYDDKLMLVRVLSEKEKHRVVLMFKKMIQSGISEKEKKKGIK